MHRNGSVTVVTAPWKMVPYDFFTPARSTHVIKIIQVMSLPQAKRTDDCADALTVTPLTSFLMYEVLSEEEIRCVQQWTYDWLCAALEQRLVEWTYVTNEATIRAIQFCYRSGLTPKEGVQYCFGARS